MEEQKQVFVVDFQGYQDLLGKFHLRVLKNAYEMNGRIISGFSKSAVTFALALTCQILDGEVLTCRTC